MKRGLVWFKNDLRLHDNEALCSAIAECDEVVYCYCVEDYLFNSLDLEFQKTGINRFKFLEESVLNLQQNLKELGGHLIIGNGSAKTFLPKIVEEFKITAIYGESEYASEELTIVNDVMEELPNISFNFYWGKTLYHIDDIPFKIARIPLTSKAYRIPTSKESTPREPFKKPVLLLANSEAKNSKFPEYHLYGFTENDYKNAKPYVTGGEDSALERLQYYTFQTELLTGYRWSRNRSKGLDYSSKFSPYLALGCISAREIYRVVKQYETTVKTNQSTWWIIFELVWRDYFTFKGMRFGDKIFKTNGFKNKNLEFNNDPELFIRWCNGTTGIPFIDAHMRQLNEVGYMSNRGRVNCSSYLIHDLKIDWTWGAAYFESKLIDYDVSANWLNWHVQAFEIYYTNPVNQSNKYKAQDFIRMWIPELSKLDDLKVLIPWEFEVKNYPKPIELYKKWQRSINKIKTELS